MNLNLSLLIPEWIAVGTLLTLITAGVFQGEKAAPKQGETFSFLWVLVAFLPFISVILCKDRVGSAFGDMFTVNSFSIFWKGFFSLSFAGVVWMSREFFRTLPEKTEEFLLISWSILIGLFFLASSNDLLLMFISLEIVTLSFYVLAAYARKKIAAIEAGLKYLIIGSLASAFMIFGIALIYFAVGSTNFDVVKSTFTNLPDNKLILWGVLLIVSGLGFKVASVPFHLWTPDVYQGAPTPVVAFLSIASKAAGFVLFLKLFLDVFAPFADYRFVLFSSLAVMTMLYGNLGALLQTNIKRLLGYSSIGHAGYLLMAIAVGNAQSTVSLLYYFIAYGVTNLAAFFVITIVSQKVNSEEIQGYTGLARRSPLLAATLFLSFLSLAGIPPLAGFFGKFLILISVVRGGMYWLAIVGALVVPVSLYYYLSVIKTVYVDASTHDEEKIEVNFSTKIILGVLILGILVIGIWQAPFLSIAGEAVTGLF